MPDQNLIGPIKDLVNLKFQINGNSFWLQFQNFRVSNSLLKIKKVLIKIKMADIYIQALLKL